MNTLQFIRVRLNTLARFSELLRRFVQGLECFGDLGHGQVARITDLGLQLPHLSLQVVLRVLRKGRSMLD